MALALDGSGHGNNTGSTVNVSLPAGGANRVVLLFVEANGGPITGITDTAGLSWSFRANDFGVKDEELWYAVDSAGAANTITVTQSASDFITVDVLGISGADTASPFDGAAVTGHPDPLSISTSNADTFIAAGYRMSSTSNPTAGTGFTQLSAAQPDWHLAEYKIVSTTQTGLSCTIGTGAGDANGGVVQAIKAAAAASAPVLPIMWSVLEGPAYSIALRTWLNGPPRTAAVQPPPPIMWRMIEGAPYPTALHTWARRSQTIVLSVRPPPVYHYPVPRGADYPFGLYTAVNQRVQFTPKQTVMNYNWPVPRTPEYPIALRTWLNGAVRSPVVVAPPPNCDYPVPRGQDYPLSLRTLINQAVQFQPTAAQPPLSCDFPVPREPPYPVGLRTWIMGFQAQLQPAPVRPPVTNYEWPYARDVVFPTSLRTFIGLINPAFIPPPAPTTGDDDYVVWARRRGRR